MRAVWVVEFQSGRSRITGEPLWHACGGVAHTSHSEAYSECWSLREARPDIKYRVVKYVPAKKGGR